MSTWSESTPATPSRRVLFDANVLLDVLARREPHFTGSAAAWALAESGAIEGYAAAHTFTTLHYLYARQTSWQEATLAVRKLLRVFQAAAVDQEVLEAALGFSWADFEDAVQMAAAERAGCDYLVTRNPDHFEPAAVSAIGPVELLAVFNPGLSG
jgi:predicted nucleic acid-binding protein